MKKVSVRQRLCSPKCVIVNSLNPRKRLRLKKIPFVPRLLPPFLSNLQRLWDCLAAITQIQNSLPLSHKTTAAVESFCPWGKKTMLQWQLQSITTRGIYLSFFLFFFFFLIACRSQNATQLCILGALWEPTHANVLFTLWERVHHEREASPCTTLTLPTSKHMKY